MAYEKQTWKCGDIVSAEKLNHMEDGIAECCSGGDKGYECTEEWTTLTEESVTTAVPEQSIIQDAPANATLTYTMPIDAETLIVTFEGVEYECQRHSTEFGNIYGAYAVGGPPDFSEYPFVVTSVNDNGGIHNLITTETAGTYSVKIEADVETIETTECFEKAVNSVVNIPNIPNIAIIYSSQLGTPSADGISRNNIAYTHCDDASRDNVDMYLWDGMDSYNGEPIIYVFEDEPGNGFYFVSAFDQFELCAYDEEEDATGTKLGLKERTKVLRLYGADGEKVLVSPNTQFYKYDLK